MFRSLSLFPFLTGDCLRAVLTLSLLVLLGLPATAHPGHGSTVAPSESAAHWLLEPFHLLIWLGAGLLILSLRRALREWKSATERKAAKQRVEKP